MFTVMDALSATTIIEVFFCKDVRDKRGGSIICFFPSFCSSTFCVLFLENYFLISSPFFLYNHKTHSYFYPFNHLLKIRIKKKRRKGGTLQAQTNIEQSKSVYRSHDRKQAQKVFHWILFSTPSFFSYFSLLIFFHSFYF